jgi:hypothetical protein
LAPRCASRSLKDIPNAKDHPLVTRYPESVNTEYRFSEFDEVMFPLAKANNQGVFEKSQRVEGKVTLIGHASPAHRSVLEIYRNYESALLKSGFQVLWSCINNDGCGPGPTQLASVGGEDWSWGSRQRFLVAKSPRATGDAYVSVHVGQWRGAVWPIALAFCRDSDQVCGWGVEKYLGAAAVTNCQINQTVTMRGLK